MPGRRETGSEALCSAVLLLVLSCALPLMVTCGKQAPEEVTSETASIDFTTSLEQAQLVRTSVLRFPLPRDARYEGKSARVLFSGQINEVDPFQQDVFAFVELTERDGYDLVLEVEQALFEAIESAPSATGEGDTFWGKIEIFIQDERGTIARGEVPYVELEFFDAFPPEIETISNPGTIYPGQLISVMGAHILRPEEGQTWAIVNRGTQRSGTRVRDIKGVRVPIRWTGSRTRGGLHASPLLVGIREGELEVSLRFENELRGGAGVVEGVDVYDFQGKVGESFISSVSPSSGSRGDIITLKGRGFVESSEVGGYAMYLRFEGNFYPAIDPSRVQSYVGPEAIGRVPFRVVDEQTIEQDVWYDVDRERFVLSGLGATPGRFEGRVSPVLVLGGEEEIGRGMPLTFEVTPTRQVVHVRFLPSFELGLDRFGMRNVSRAVKNRILEVMRRDYANYAVEIVEQPPEDVARYMTIEIGGADPTGMNLLGYDNSFNGVPKDTGNLFLDDYLGGYNRPGQKENFSAYGGVFIESLVIFSETLSGAMGAAHPRFDEVLGPIMPELGGNRINADEWPISGESERTRAIEAAIHMVGSVAGNTATHEVGHSFGLPFVEGERADDVRYHNRDGDDPYIMDAGYARPFLERAELDGTPPAIFSPTNDAYLRRILPRQ